MIVAVCVCGLCVGCWCFTVCLSVCLQASVSRMWVGTWREIFMTCRSEVVTQYSSGISSIARILLLSVRLCHGNIHT